MNDINKIPSSEVEETVESKANISTTAETKISAPKTDYNKNDISDESITSLIKEQIMNDPLLSKFHINVITQNGNVELSGSVNYQKGINRSLEIANGVKGVKSVESEIFAKKEEAELKKAEEPLAVSPNRTERRSNDSSIITNKIKADVSLDPSVNIFQVKIITTGGIVNISGGVDTVQSIERMHEIVGKVKGVKSIESHLFSRKVE